MRLQQLIYQGIVWRGLYYVSVFMLNIVMARVLEADGSGTINYLINNFAFVLLITSLSLESALGYFAARSEINLDKLTGNGLLCALMSACISPFAVLLFSAPNYGEFNANFFLFAFVYVLGLVLINYFSAMFYALQQVMLPNALMILINALVIGIGLYRYGGKAEVPDDDKFAFGVIFLFSGVVQGILLFFIWMIKHRFRIALPSRAELKMVFNYSFAALVANVIFFLVYRVDYWFIKSFCTDAELGNYIQVSKLGQIFLLLPTIVATAIFTRTAGGKQEHTRNVIQIISRWLLLLYVIFVLAIIIVGKWLFPAIYGQTFDEMYGPFLLLSPGILALSTLSLLGAFNAGKNKIGINIKGSAIALVVIIIGDLLLVPKYGIYAAALVSSVGYICYQVYLLNHFKNEYGSNIFDFFIPKASDWRMVKEFISQIK